MADQAMALEPLHEIGSRSGAVDHLCRLLLGAVVAGRVSLLLLAALHALLCFSFLLLGVFFLLTLSPVARQLPWAPRVGAVVASAVDRLRRLLLGAVVAGRVSLLLLAALHALLCFSCLLLGVFLLTLSPVARQLPWVPQVGAVVASAVLNHLFAPAN